MISSDMGARLEAGAAGEKLLLGSGESLTHFAGSERSRHQRCLGLHSVADFGVHDGLRTEAKQREYVRTCASQTMDSLHRKQADGWGHAGDQLPFINGTLRWE